MWRWLKLEHCLDDLHTILYFYGKKYGEKSCDYGWNMIPRIENAYNDMVTTWNTKSLSHFDKIELGLKKLQILNQLVNQFLEKYNW